MLKNEIHFSLVGKMISKWENCESLPADFPAQQVASSRLEHSDSQLYFLLPFAYLIMIHMKRVRVALCFSFPTWYLVGIPFFLSTDLGLVSLCC